MDKQVYIVEKNDGYGHTWIVLVCAKEEDAKQFLRENNPAEGIAPYYEYHACPVVE